MLVLSDESPKASIHRLGNVVEERIFISASISGRRSFCRSRKKKEGGGNERKKYAAALFSVCLSFDPVIPFFFFFSLFFFLSFFLSFQMPASDGTKREDENGDDDDEDEDGLESKAEGV